MESPGMRERGTEQRGEARPLDRFERFQVFASWRVAASTGSHCLELSDRCYPSSY